MKKSAILLALAFIAFISCKKDEEDTPPPVTPETTFQGRVELTSLTYFNQAIYNGDTINSSEFDYPNEATDPNLSYTSPGWKWVDTIVFNKGINHIIKTKTEQSDNFCCTNNINIKVYNNSTGSLIKDTTINDPSYNNSGSPLYYNSSATFRAD